MTFERIADKRYLASGLDGSGYEITYCAEVWRLYRLENIENQASSEMIGEFSRLNDAKAFAREHNMEEIE